MGEIAYSDLARDGVSDPTALPEILDQIDEDVSHFIADEAYDGDPTSELLVKFFGVDVEITIPPPKAAVFSAKAASNSTLRDQRILRNMRRREDGLAGKPLIQSAQSRRNENGPL